MFAGLGTCRGWNAAVGAGVGDGAGALGCVACPPHAADDTVIDDCACNDHFRTVSRIDSIRRASASGGSVLVTMPTTRPHPSSSGPPEFPGATRSDSKIT